MAVGLKILTIGLFTLTAASSPSPSSAPASGLPSPVLASANSEILPRAAAPAVIATAPVASAVINPISAAFTAGPQGDCKSAPMVAASETSPSSPPVTPRLGFEIGDTVKLILYEAIKDNEAEKWGKGDPNFQQRPEFSGEFAVQDDGTLSVPLLGSFQVANRPTQYLQSAMASSFETLTGHKGFVTVVSVERPPIYVLGPVKTPGSYKYAPGMTVLHAVALAGGFDKLGGNNEPWQRMEAVRATIGRENTLETMTETLARVAVLKAERDNVAVQVPPRLLQLVGDAEANRLIAVETGRRAAIVSARNTRLQMMAASVDTAKREVQLMETRGHPFDDLVKSREERASAMKSLMTSGVVNRNYLIQAQGELADTEQRQADSINQLALAHQRVGQLQQDRVKAESDMRAELDTAILAGEQQIAASERETMVSDGVLEVLNVTVAPPGSGGLGGGVRLAGGVDKAVKAGPATLTYEIVRQTPNGPVVLAASEITTVAPGDLVRLVTPADLERDGASQVSMAPLPKGCLTPTSINAVK